MNCFPIWYQWNRRRVCVYTAGLSSGGGTLPVHFVSSAHFRDLIQLSICCLIHAGIFIMYGKQSSFSPFCKLLLAEILLSWFRKMNRKRTSLSAMEQRGLYKYCWNIFPIQLQSQVPKYHNSCDGQRYLVASCLWQYCNRPDHSCCHNI